jgi:hypothetical protein
MEFYEPMFYCSYLRDNLKASDNRHHRVSEARHAVSTQSPIQIKNKSDIKAIVTRASQTWSASNPTTIAPK